MFLLTKLTRKRLSITLAHWNLDPPLLTIIPAWIINIIPGKVWDEITQSFPNFNGCIIDVWEWISNFTLHISVSDYLIMLGLKLNRISKRGHWWCICYMNLVTIGAGIGLSQIATRHLSEPMLLGRVNTSSLDIRSKMARCNYKTQNKANKQNKASIYQKISLKKTSVNVYV